MIKFDIQITDQKSSPTQFEINDEFIYNDGCSRLSNAYEYQQLLRLEGINKLGSCLM